MDESKTCGLMLIAIIVGLGALRYLFEGTK
jgi:hypothetical protein